MDSNSGKNNNHATTTAGKTATATATFEGDPTHLEHLEQTVKLCLVLLPLPTNLPVLLFFPACLAFLPLCPRCAPRPFHSLLEIFQGSRLPLRLPDHRSDQQGKHERGNEERMEGREIQKPSGKRRGEAPTYVGVLTLKLPLVFK